MNAILDKHAEYKAALESVAGVTEEELRALVQELPAHIREKLAEGPLPSRYGCAVCAAFGAEWFKNPVNHKPDDPLFRVWGYHEVAKLAMQWKDDEHIGAAANDHYVRCIATYRAAGWAGEAQEPNA